MCFYCCRLVFDTTFIFKCLENSQVVNMFEFFMVLVIFSDIIFLIKILLEANNAINRAFIE